MDAEARRLLPFAALGLEPRQCAFPARSCQRVLASRVRCLALEPPEGWSVRQSGAGSGPGCSRAWCEAYPPLPLALRSGTAGSRRVLDGADLVLVHEWNRRSWSRGSVLTGNRHGGYLLLFHDTHHRMASAPEAIGAMELDGFDGVLAFGEVLRAAYLRRGWARRAFVWHEAADLRVFRPHTGDSAAARPGVDRQLGRPGAQRGAAGIPDRAGSRARAFGPGARRTLSRAGAPGARRGRYRIRRLFAEFPRTPSLRRGAATVHIPRRPYARALPGIPTIRVFEALACGIPLVSAPWDDSEGLFTPGEDFLVARNGAAMRAHLDALGNDRISRRRSLAADARRSRPDTAAAAVSTSSSRSAAPWAASSPRRLSQ